jgi:hypothetical protein
MLIFTYARFSLLLTVPSTLQYYMPPTQYFQCKLSSVVDRENRGIVGVLADANSIPTSTPLTAPLPRSLVIASLPRPSPFHLPLSSTARHSSLDTHLPHSRLRDATPTTPIRPSKGLASTSRPHLWLRADTLGHPYSFHLFAFWSRSRVSCSFD